MWGTGPMVDSVGPGSVHHLSRQGLSATLLVQSLGAVDNSIQPAPLCPIDITQKLNYPRPSPLFATFPFHVLLSMQMKNRVGLGTRPPFLALSS